MSWRKQYKAAMQKRADEMLNASIRRTRAESVRVISDLKFQLQQWKNHAKLLGKSGDNLGPLQMSALRRQQQAAMAQQQGPFPFSGIYPLSGLFGGVL